jgi:hypothetical protein
MSYRPIHDDDREEMIGQLGNTKDLLESKHQNGLRIKGGGISFDRIFQVLTLVLLTLLCFLAVLDLVMLRRQQVRGANGWSIHREHGSDHHYMSIDHTYDYLWNEEMDARKALIYLSTQEQATGRQEVGSITTRLLCNTLSS